MAHSQGPATCFPHQRKRFDQKPVAPKVRTRKIYDKEKFTGYQVVMDVFPDVIAYGILLVCGQVLGPDPSSAGTSGA